MKPKIKAEDDFIEIAVQAFRELLEHPNGWLFAFFKPAWCHVWDADIEELIQLGYEHHGCWVCKCKGLPMCEKANGWCEECAAKREAEKEEGSARQ